MLTRLYDKTMKLHKFFFYALCLFSLIFGATCLEQTDKNLSPIHYPITIVHTTDLHSRFEGLDASKFTPDGHLIAGHFGRIAHVVKNEREKAAKRGEAFLLLDSGDWMDGSLLGKLSGELEYSRSPELDFFDYLKYDAITFGNHEMGWTMEDLARILRKGSTSTSNINILATTTYYKQGTPTELFRPFVNGRPTTNTNPNRGLRVMPSLVKTVKTTASNGEISTLKVGILGSNGYDSLIMSLHARRFPTEGPHANATYMSGHGNNPDYSMEKNLEEIARSLQYWTNYLRREKEVDIVLLLFHGGEQEDCRLAKMVNGIDIILSAHTHVTWMHTCKDKDGLPLLSTQSGPLGASVGHLSLSYTPPTSKNVRGKLSFRSDNSLIPLQEELPTSIQYTITITENIPFDNTVLDMISEWKDAISIIMQKPNESQHKTFAYNETVFSLVHQDLPYDPWNEYDYYHTGAFLRNSILNGLNKPAYTASFPLPYDPIDVFMQPVHTIRGPLTRRKENGKHVSTPFSFSEMFELIPSMIPISHFYLKCEDLWNFMSIVDAGTAMFSPLFRTEYSDGIKLRVNEYGIPLINRIKSVEVFGDKLERACCGCLGNSSDDCEVDFNDKRAPGLIHIAAMFTGPQTFLDLTTSQKSLLLRLILPDVQLRVRLLYDTRSLIGWILSTRSLIGWILKKLYCHLVAKLLNSLNTNKHTH